MRHSIKSLEPMAHVRDMSASIAFYEILGFTVDGTFAADGGDVPTWASLRAGNAAMMLAAADRPILAEQQAVLFYVYCEDVAAMHNQLSEAGLAVGPISNPFYNPRGEFRVSDPDGYVVMVTHL